MSVILSVFTNNILPIFAVAGIGYSLRRWAQLDKQTISRLTFYALSPCLIFSALVTSQLAPAELGRLGLYTLVSIAVLGVIGWLVGRLLRFGREETLLIMLAAMFTNCANYGLPLNQLRYGDAGVAAASVYVVVSAILVYTVGSFLASLGRRSGGEALRNLLRLPVIYAIIAALVVYGWQIALPAPLLTAIDIAAAGAVPVMLIILGMQIADTARLENLRVTFTATAVRLIAGPLVGVAVAAWIGLQGVSRNSAVLEASLPVAVAPIILATEFDLQPRTLTGIVTFSTLISPLALVAAIQLFGL